MAPSSLQHRRAHNLLLISKLLNQRDAASPFTLVLDSLEQSGRPLITEYLKRAKAAKVHLIYVSFETLKQPLSVTAEGGAFIEAWNKTVQEWQAEVTDELRRDVASRKLLIFDSLNTLAATEAANLPALLSSFISPTASLLAVYHTDIPTRLPEPTTSSSNSDNNPYAPQPLTLLKYLATTIFTTHSLHHIVARKAARERSHVEPSFGLEESVEGVIQGLGANGVEGLVLEMEHRRRSGRVVREWYYLPTPRSSTVFTSEPSAESKARETVILLGDHPAYRSKAAPSEAVPADSDAQESTFELGLTDKQRRDREGVVLPYFDAQQGGGEGGRILYDMGSEDDFDEEEDEI